MNNYSSKLNKNNADLRLCIEKANSLPDYCGPSEDGVDLFVQPNVTTPKGETPEPNDFVEKLYFNTKLSAEEVRDYIWGLTNNESRFYTMPIFGYADENRGVYYTLYHIWESYMGYMTPENTIIITEHKWTGSVDNWETKWIYVSREINEEELQKWSSYASSKYKLTGISTPPSFIGWNPEFTYPIEINLSYNDLEYCDNVWYDLGLTYGSILKGDLSLIVSKNSFDLIKVPSPIQGNTFINNIYFNTTLSADEVVSLVNIDYTTIFINDYMRIYWEVYSGDTEGSPIYLIKCYNNDNTEIFFISRALNESERMYWNTGIAPDYVGWNPNLSNPLKVNSINSLNGAMNIGLNNIISTTSFEPFNIKLKESYSGEMVEINGNNNIVDLIPMIENGKIPTAIYFTGECIQTVPSLSTDSLSENDLEKIYRYNNRLYTVELDMYNNPSFKDVYMGTPMEIDSLDESLLIDRNYGHVYKCNNKLYIIERKKFQYTSLSYYELLCNFSLMNDKDKFSELLTDFYKNNINFTTYDSNNRCYILPFGISYSKFYFEVSYEGSDVRSFGVIQGENYIKYWDKYSGITSDCPLTYKQVFCENIEEVRYNETFVDFLREAFVLKQGLVDTYTNHFIELKIE